MDKRKVLIAGDEPSIRALVSSVLDGDYVVLEASDDEEVVDIARSRKPDRILLDIKLPGMSGIELYRRLEAIDPALAQRVMFITGDVMEATTRDFLDKTKACYIN